MIDRVLSRLNDANRTAVFLVTTLAVIATLFIGGWPAAIALLLVATVVLGLLVARWESATARQRAMRLVVFALLVALAILTLSR